MRKLKITGVLRAVFLVLTVTGILLDKGGPCGKSLEPFCDKIYHSSDLTEDEIALDILNSKVS